MFRVSGLRVLGSRVSGCRCRVRVFRVWAFVVAAPE